jgi:hypothetical protein
MKSASSGSEPLGIAGETWIWWQARRLQYNLVLASSGIAAYVLFVALFSMFGSPLWKTWRDAASMTLLMGVGFLVLMGVANVCFVLGPIMESLVKPADPGRYRRTTYAMGLLGSAALPFVVPAVALAGLIAQAPH